MLFNIVKSKGLFTMGKYRENINCKKPVKFLNKEKTVMCGNWLLFDYIPPKKIKKTLKQKKK